MLSLGKEGEAPPENCRVVSPQGGGGSPFPLSKAQRGHVLRLRRPKLSLNKRCDGRKGCQDLDVIVRAKLPETGAIQGIFC